MIHIISLDRFLESGDGLRMKDKETDLPPTDFKKLEESIRQKLMIEIFHNMGLLPNNVYYTKYAENAEALDRDYKIWKDLEEIK